jgi:hypothetical protein
LRLLSHSHPRGIADEGRKVASAPLASDARPLSSALRIAPGPQAGIIDHQQIADWLKTPVGYRHPIVNWFTHDDKNLMSSEI